MNRLTERHQRTIASPALIEGTGYITGKHVHLRFLPAPTSSGVVFIRTDLGPKARIEARVESVTGTHRRTTLGAAPLSVELVEHVLAALSGLRIDNCIVELDAPEPPGLDGSAAAFVEVLHKAGIVSQTATRGCYGVDQTIIVRNETATLALHPGEGDALRISYLLDYGNPSPITRQVFTAEIRPETFANEIAGCRTFLLEEEALMLQKQGIGKNSRMSDLLVFGPNGPRENKLRFGNEPARHKILDILGDLSLLGHDLRGHIVAYRSGHPLNIELARALKAKTARRAA